MLWRCCWAKRLRATSFGAAAERAVVSAVFEAEARRRRPREDSGNERTGRVRRWIIDSAARDCGCGKGRVFVNNQPATVAVLRQLAPHLAIVHAQNESILSISMGRRGWNLLDSFAGSRAGYRDERRLQRGGRFARASTNWNRASRTGCGWWICGFFRSAKSKKPTCRAGKTNDSKPRSASWPTRRKSTTRP